MDPERPTHSAAVAEDERRRGSSRCTRSTPTATSRRASRCASASCACFALLAGLGPARDRLDRVRDDDGRRLRPAASSRSRRRPNSVIVDRRGEPLGRLTGNQKRILLDGEPDRAGDEARDHRDRGQALLHQRRRRPARHRPRAVPGRRRQAGGPGRLDDRPAVRQERARRPGPADAVREAARGRAGLPHHAQVVQGEDPAQLPQLDLLRQRRLRHRVRRPHLLRQPAPGLRRATARGPAPPSSSRTRPR